MSDEIICLVNLPVVSKLLITFTFHNTRNITLYNYGLKVFLTMIIFTFAILKVNHLRTAWVQFNVLENQQFAIISKQ